MKIFRSSRTAEKHECVRAEIVDPYGDEFSEDEDPARKATEIENILGNALAMTERSNGSIHSLHRSGTNSAIEIGRRIATMHSRENMAISDAHLSNNDSFSYISRTSSLGSVASLPTFVRVERGDPVISAQQSWDNIASDYHEEKDDEQNSSTNSGYENMSHRNMDAPQSQTSNRSWNKLRREVNEEEKAIPIPREEEGTAHSKSIGRKAFSFRKNILRDSLNMSLNRQQSKDNRAKSCSSRSYSGDAAGKRSKNNPNRGYAKDYDVEVSLETKESFWDRHSSIIRGEKGKKTFMGSAFKSRSRNTEKSKDSGTFEKTNQLDVNNSFDTPKTDAEESSQTPAVDTMVERKPNVVVKMHEIHRGDALFQALEVACCHSINGETLDLITDLVPPQV